jgi:hypothetical protein
MSRAQKIIDRLAADLQYAIEKGYSEKHIDTKRQQLEELAGVINGLGKRAETAEARAEKTTHAARTAMAAKIAELEARQLIFIKLFVAFEIDLKTVNEALQQPEVLDELLYQKNNNWGNVWLDAQRAEWSRAQVLYEMNAPAFRAADVARARENKQQQVAAMMLEKIYKAEAHIDTKNLLVQDIAAKAFSRITNV